MLRESDGVFIDTNILIYATFPDFDSAKHIQCLESLNQLLQSDKPLFVSSQILREFFAISTNGGIFKKPLTCKQAVGKMKEFLKRFNFIPEKETTVLTLINLIEKYAVSRQKIHDLNIVATMIDHGVSHLLTYDKKDFKRINEINLYVNNLGT
jgi:predicted nucleic acid-binding protein